MKNLTCIVLLGAGLSIFSFVGAQMPPAQETNGIRYVTGGVGLDESNAFKVQRGNYNLYVLITAKNGDFLSKLPVKIIDGRKRVILEAETNGPYFYAHLPAGNYQVQVNKGENSQKRNVSVGKKGGANLHLIF